MGTKGKKSDMHQIPPGTHLSYVNIINSNRLEHQYAFRRVPWHKGSRLRRCDDVQSLDICFIMAGPDICLVNFPRPYEGLRYSPEPAGRGSRAQVCPRDL